MSKDYGVGSIRQLKGLQAVRERTSMYLGDPTSGDALHQLIWEVVDNSVDEHLAGFCAQVRITFHTTGYVTVVDDGRGIPVGMHPTEGRNTLEMVMTSLHAGGKFDNEAYAFSAGLHGVGVSAVNAVSEHLKVIVYGKAETWTQDYSRGAPTTPVAGVHGLLSPLGKTGTSVTWKWDPQIFSGTTTYDMERVGKRLQELAFLNPGLVLELAVEKGSKTAVTPYRYDNGVTEFVELLVAKKKATTKVFGFRTKSVEMAFAWTQSEEDVRCYANNTYNRDGGTHLTGFRQGITKLIGDYIKKHELDKGLADGVQGGDIREGLIGVVSVRIKNPSFSSQTKDKLVTPTARDLVVEVLEDQFRHFLENNPTIAKRIAETAVLNARAREAARKAKEEVKRKDFTDMLSLPGKLADCQTKKPWEAEIFLVEGDSAGGSGKGGRDRRFQAILPLRGKVLNVERANIETILENKEIGTIITALGCGLENTRGFDLDKLRYHKVVIMTDADVDGAHIRTLLLTLFYRCMPRLIHEGYIYIARPPLYGAHFAGRKEMRYFANDDEFLLFTEQLSEKQRVSLRVTRFKGLGEMNPEALWETTLNPETRTLHQVSIDDAVAAENLFYNLMGEDVETRRAWIEHHALDATLDV